MNAAEMKRAAGRALELGLTGVLTVPVSWSYWAGGGGGGVAVGEPHAAPAGL